MKAETLIRKYNRGKRNFSGADLSCADLRETDLSYADLSYADLHRVDLSWANLHGSNLRGANLHRADLYFVNFSGADLSGANLRNANLHCADLHCADLRGVDLHGADLYEANLYLANSNNAFLSNTCLDPMNTPNGECSAFEDFDNGWKIGYRTKHSTHVGNTEYIVGEEYSAPVFSTSETECHPGLYVCPSIAVLKKFLDDFVGNNVEIVSVIFQPWNCHQAGEKYRVREFIVWEDFGRTRISETENPVI